MKIINIKNMRSLRYICVSFLLLLGCVSSLYAQEITVSATAKYSPMPAQAGLYLDNPGKYFTISINNPNDEAYRIFLGMQIEQISGGELTLTTPLRRQPSKPVTIPAHTNRTLTQVELRELFREMKMSEIIIGGGSLTAFTSGAVGLLPEGNYKGFITAYLWDPAAADPQAISNPSTGICFFDICYKAPAPEILWPGESVMSFLGSDVFTDDDELASTATVIDLEKNPNPVFSWMPSICPCAAGFGSPTYNLEFYELTPGLSPNEVISYGRMSYHVDNLASTSFALNLPPTTRKMIFTEGKTYVMRVVAKSPQEDAAKDHFVLIENEGVSPLRVFRIAKSDENEEETPTVPVTPDDKKKDKLEKQVKNAMIFTVPKLTKPEGSRDLMSKYAITEGADIEVEWSAPEYVEGIKEIADTIKHFTYSVGIYAVNTGTTELDSILKQKPLLQKKEYRDTLTYKFEWKKIEEAKLNISQQHAIIVTAKPTYFKDQKNDEKKGIIPDTLSTLTFTGEPNNVHSFVKAPDFTESGDCYPDDIVLDVAPKDWDIADLKKEKIAIGDFDLYITSAEKNSKFTGIREPKKGGGGGGAPGGGAPGGGDKGGGDKSAGDKGTGDSAPKAEGDKSGDAKAGDAKAGDAKAGGSGKGGATKVDGPAYKGSGYIVWSPYGKPIKIAVEFDSLRINKDRIVIEGVARSARNNDENIPYDQIERLTKLIGVDRGNYDSYTDELKKLSGDYWKYVSGGLGYANTIAQLIDGGIAGGAGGTDPINLPLSMAGISEMVPDGIPMDISMMNMRFSPTTASMDVFVTVSLPDLDAVKGGAQVLGFAAPGLCMTPESPWTRSGRVALMYDLTLQSKARDYEITFEAPTSYKEINDGTFIEWKDGEFERMRIECSMNLPDIIPDDGTGKPIKGQNGVNLGIGYDVTDWDDWILDVDMMTNEGKKVTGFMLKEAEGYTFIPGGKIVFDHSKKRNYEGIKFPKEYDWTKWGMMPSQVTSKPELKNQWQGLYIQSIDVRFPYTMKMEDNDSKADNRMGISTENIFFDETGYTLTAGLKNVLRAGNIDSFSFSVSSIYFNMVQSDYLDAGFKGEVTIPLIGGKDKATGKTKKSCTMAYDAKFMYLDKDPMDAKLNDAPTKEEQKEAAEDLKFEEETKELMDKHGLLYTASWEEEKEREWYFMFNCSPKDDISMDWFIADINIDKNGTYLQINSKATGGKQYCEFVTSGTLGISSSLISKEEKAALPFKIPDVHFTGLRIANFAYNTKASDRFAANYGKVIENAYKEYEKAKVKDPKATNNYDWIKKDDIKKFVSEVDESIIKNEIHDGPGSCYFTLGNWSLASLEKKLWGIPFKLNGYELKKKTAEDGANCVGLYLNGGVGLLGNEKFGIGATAGFTIWAKVNWSDFDIDYHETEFNDVQLQGQFGGVVTVEGSLSVEKSDEKKGMSGSLDINVKGMFKGAFAGGYYEIAKTEADKKIDTDSGIDINADDYDTKYKAGYFFGEVSEIPAIGPVTLNGIRGGFYFNYATNTGDAKGKDAYVAALKKPIPKYGVAGGAFGFDMVVGEESFVKGDLTMNILIDLKAGSVREFHMQGNCHALCASKTADSGLINASVDIIYTDNTTSANKADELKRFKLNITADMKADVKTLYKDFTGTEFKLDKAFAELDEFSQEKADDQGDDSNGSDHSTTDGNSRSKSKAEKEAEAKGYIQQGIGATISMELEVRYYPNKTGKEQKKWHLYVGEPDESKRCRLTFIDFALGKNKPVGMWAKLYANFYCCLGNELPNNGALPPLPAKVSEALGGKAPDGSSNSGTVSKLEAARKELIDKGPNGSTNGGIMVGAALGAEFGCNAVFCYCNLEGMAGFDAILKQFDTSSKCTDGSQMGGKNGFYATAQVYAMLKGELGLMLDLWIYKGKIPLVDMTLGAVLKGGLPNPSWAYGKVRASGKVLGGLIKFNSSIEMKVGHVCIPAYGNPLDDIKIFGDVSPGDEKMATGWSDDNKISPYGNMSFTTNMRIDSKLTLVDEKLRAKMAGMNGDEEKYTNACMRTYVFHLDKDFQVEKFQNKNSDAVSNRSGVPFRASYTTNDHENYTVGLGSLTANSYYKITLTGYAKEIIDGREVDPLFNDSTTNYKDVHRPWTQSYTNYFCTSNYSQDMYDEVAFHLPVLGTGQYFDDTNSIKGNVSLEEAANPALALRHIRDDYWNNPDYEFEAEYTVPLDGKKIFLSDVFGYPDLIYNDQYERLPGQTSKFEHLGVQQMVEKGVDAEGNAFAYATVCLKKPLNYTEFKKNTAYKFTVYRTDRKAMDDYFKKVEETYANMMKAVKSQTADVAAQLKEWESDESNPLLQEMAKYYSEMDQAYGGTTAEQRMREFKTKLASNTAAFRSEVYSFTFQTGDNNTVKEQGIDNNSIMFVGDKNNREYVSATQWSDLEIIYKTSKSRSVSNDPYYSLNYWLSTGGIQKSNIPKFVLNGNAFVTTTNVYKWDNLVYNGYRKVGMIDAGKYSNDNFRMNVSPEGYEEWIRGEKTAGRFYTIPERWRKMIISDAYLAEEMCKVIKNRWNSVVGTYMDNGVAKTNTTTKLKSKGTGDKIFKDWKKYVERIISDGILCTASADGSSLSWHPYQLAYMYAASDSKTSTQNRMGLTLYQLGTSVTSQGYYMDGTYTTFTALDYLKSISAIRYKVRRATGFNTLEGVSVDRQLGVRPSTAGVYMATVTRDLKYDSSKSTLSLGGTTSTVFDESVYIPDAKFKEYIIANFDSNKDGSLSRAEARNIRKITLQSTTVYSLQGIEAMDNLEELDVYNDHVKEVTLNFNSKLKKINVGNNYLTALDLSCCPDLEEVKCSYYSRGDEVDATSKKGLTAIDVSGLKKLKYLDVSWNSLTKLDVSECTALETIMCHGNSLTTLDLLNCHYVKKVDAGRQYYPSGSKYYCKRKLTVKLGTYVLQTDASKYIASTGGTSSPGVTATYPKSTAHTNANVYYTTQYTLAQNVLDPNLSLYLIKNYGKLKLGAKALDLSKDLTLSQIAASYAVDNEALLKVTELKVPSLGIKTIDKLVGFMPNLEKLYINDNELTELDLTGFNKLTYVNADKNRIVDVTFPKVSELKELHLNENAITDLDMSLQKKLKYLYISDNSLLTLNLDDVSLWYLCARNNQLNSLKLTNQTGMICLSVSGNPFYINGDGTPQIYWPSSTGSFATLELAGTDITNINLNTFSKLTTLDLNNSQLLTKFYAPSTLMALKINDTPVLSSINGNTDITKIATLFPNLTKLYMNRCATKTYSYNTKSFVFYDTKLTYLEMIDSPQGDVYIKGSLAETGSYYVGVPNRRTGSQVLLTLYTDKAVSRWQTIFKRYANNKYVVHYQEGVGATYPGSSARALEQITDADLTMQEELGKTLYDRLKEEHAKTKRAFHVADAKALTTVDASYSRQTTVDAVKKYFPNVVYLNLAGNELKTADLTALTKLKELNISHNDALTSLSTPSTLRVANISTTKLNNSTFTGLLSKCTKVVADNVSTITGEVSLNTTAYQYLEELSLHGSKIKRLNIGSPVKSLRKLVYDGNEEKHQLAFYGGPASVNVLDTLIIGTTKPNMHIYGYYVASLLNWYNKYSKQTKYSHNVRAYYLPSGTSSNLDSYIEIPAKRFDSNGNNRGADVISGDLTLVQYVSGPAYESVRQQLCPDDYVIRYSALVNATRLDFSKDKLASFNTKLSTINKKLHYLNLDYSTMESIDLSGFTNLDSLRMASNFKLKELTLPANMKYFYSYGSYLSNASITNAFNSSTYVNATIDGGTANGAIVVSATSRVERALIYSRNPATFNIASGKTLKSFSLYPYNSSTGSEYEYKIYFLGKTKQWESLYINASLKNVSLYFQTRALAQEAKTKYARTTNPIKFYYKTTGTRGSIYVAL